LLKHRQTKWKALDEQLDKTKT
jgi:hypothetical protein